MGIIEKAASKLDQIEKEKKALITKEQASREFDQKSEIGQSEVANEIDQTLLHGAAPQSNLAIIDLTRLRQLGMVTPNEEKTQIVEEFRIIKRPLITNAFKQGAGKIKNGNLIMVTSALVGEGKSFCAINLAMSIAMEMDHTVLLVDADVAQPSIPKYLGLKNEKGLLDVLLDDKLELADVMLRTNVEKLSILTSGRKSRHATELLASQSMSDLLTEIAQRYHERIVIFDSPPLLLASESPVLATQMGQIVLVVEAETTPQKTVMEALQKIESCDAINLIYNKASPFPGGDSYGYYYN
jgi:protein-tyrosine kinase